MSPPALTRNPFHLKNRVREDERSELLARAGWIALDLDTTRFSLLSAGACAEIDRVSLLLDNEQPQTSTASRALTGPKAKPLLEHMLCSTLPCVWSSSVPGQHSLPLLREISPPVIGTDGIAFPVATASGEAGLVVFFSIRVKLEEDLLFDIHARCFQLFEAAAAFAQGECATVPIASRERHCLELSSLGLTSEEIARKLGLSPHTINQYLTNTARKLDAANRVHVVAKALRLGLIS